MSDYKKFGFEHYQIILLRTIARVLAGVSSIGLICVFITFWCYKALRSFAYELVVWLCFSNIIYNISFFLPVDNYDYSHFTANHLNNEQATNSCIIQSVLSTFGDLSTFIGTFAIGLTAYFSVSDQEHFEQRKKCFRIVFYSFTFLFPLIFSIILFITKANGSTGIWCWIEETTTANKIFIILYYCFLWIIIGLNIFFVVKLIYILRKELKYDDDLIDKYTNKLRMFPIIQIVSVLPATINRIYAMANGKEMFAMSLITTICDSTTGLFFSIVYGFNPSVKKALHDTWRKILRRTATAASNQEQFSIEVNRHSYDTDGKKRSLTSLEENVLTDESR